MWSEDRKAQAARQGMEAPYQHGSEESKVSHQHPKRGAKGPAPGASASIREQPYGQSRHTEASDGPCQRASKGQHSQRCTRSQESRGRGVSPKSASARHARPSSERPEGQGRSERMCHRQTEPAKQPGETWLNQR